MRIVDLRNSTLTSLDGARLIAALNAELTAAFPEPGATHFSLTGAQVGAGEGAFLIAYLDNAAVESVLNWRFIPAMRNGDTVSDWAAVKIVYQLPRLPAQPPAPRPPS